MTLEEMRARQTEIRTRLTEIDNEAGTEPLVEETRTEWDTLNGEYDQLETRAKDVEERRGRVIKLAADPLNVESGEDRGAPHLKKDDDPNDLDSIRVSPFADPGVIRGELKGRAQKVLERADSWEIDDASKQRITRLLERFDGPDENGAGGGDIAKRILATSTPEYKRAFAKYIHGRQMAWTPEEQHAVARAMSLTDGAGGFAVPFPIDPTLINLGAGTLSPFRQIARVIPNHPTDTWQGLATTQMTASFDAEAAEVSDDTTTFTQPQITVHMARAFVPASIQISQDYPNLVGDLTELFTDAKMTLEDSKFAVGSGTGEPFGVVTTLPAGSIVASATTDVFAVADVYNVAEALPPRFRNAASRNAWVSNLAIYHDIRQFGAAGNPGPFITEANADSVLGRRWYEASEMDGTITALADNKVLLFGDWRYYVIVDRVGFNLEYIPHLFATANNLPSGQRGWFAWWRVGADVVADPAFRLLNVT